MFITWAVLFSALIFSCSNQREVSFNQHIRPILNKNCLVCHGGIKQLGEFSMLFEEDAYRETKSGKPAIVPGSHNKSEIYRRIVHADPELRMPQEAEPLTQEEIDLIAEWIDQGAKWEKHWAFIPPEMPEIPSTPSEWVKNDIDRLVLDKLNQLDLEPEAEANRATLARRLSLDLTGLPPTIEQVEAFEKDPSPQAYERYVDRLMDSPQYGERWTAWWLDLARYADSKGYEKDPPRTIWRYRDWVIDAFNNDKPFDQFTIEQLAGDLLAEAGPEELVATAFNRNTMTNTEGGTEDEEFRVASVVDRVNTTFEVWQSLTMGCVQCHDHPYDPIRQPEFYQAYAFFNTTQDNDLNLEFPLYEAYSPEVEKEIRQIVDWIEDLKEDPVTNQDLLSEQIQRALYPRLFPQHVDDFQSVIIYGDFLLSNWSNNANSQKDKEYYFMFEDIPMDHLNGITLNFSSGGPDAQLIVYLDSLGGSTLVEIDLPFSGEVRGAEWQGQNAFLEKSWEISSSYTGYHDLIFQLVNTTNELPDGIAMIKEMRLGYETDKYNSARLIELQDQLAEMQMKADRTPIMKERRAFLRETHVFDRGNWLLKGVQVEPGVPSEMPGLSNDHPQNRLGLAQWLTSPENPLTARVLVNRLWEQLFGNGIIETTEDFGTQGSAPTHPELLDFLAIQAVDVHHWSIKSILKEMVMSATYRQASRVTPEKLDKDPYNLYLSRGARFRLSAEQIRDQALAVSGLLDPSIGGESVMPPQPDGIWQVIYSNYAWETQPEDKYRRGLYTFWRRTTPYPSMVSFDSPSREFCVSRRIRTNTPLQALITLNDPVYLEASQALARRMERESGGGLEEAITRGHQLALGRRPDAQTVEILSGLYDQASTDLPATATETEIEPMTIVANAIMNLDEFVTKE